MSVHDSDLQDRIYFAQRSTFQILQANVVTQRNNVARLRENAVAAVHRWSECRSKIYNNKNAVRILSATVRIAIRRWRQEKKSLLKIETELRDLYNVLNEYNEGL